MRISRRSGRLARELGVKLAMAAAVAGTMWAGSASALTTDNLAPLSSQTQVASTPRYSPGVADVLKMLDAKVDTEVLKAYIKNSPTAYTLSAEDIINLKKRGMPDEIVTVMIQHGAEVRTRAAAPTQAAPETVPYSAPQSDVYASAPDYGYSDYGYPYYPSSYGYGYPYNYNYWWWSNYGYPWYGFYSPFFFVDSFGHRHFHGNHHGGFDHHGFHAGRNFQGHGNFSNMGRGEPWRPVGTFGNAGQGQPWRPVGTFASRSGSGSPFSSARSFAARPAGSFASRSPAIAARTGGFHSGGGFSGHAMGGGHR